MKRPIANITFDESLYPRDGYDQETVNLYGLNLHKLPPIAISPDGVLIDGYHRLIAHRLAQIQDIDVEIVQVSEPGDILREAIKRNVMHGRQLTMSEKRRWARKFFSDLTVEEASELLSVSTGKISEWTTDLQQEQREEEKARIIDLWLQCKTQGEIAHIIGKDQSHVSKIITNFRNEKNHILSQTPPDSLRVFNLWSFGKAEGLTYPGQIPRQIMENLLWYFTKPFDIVYDPMSGSGAIISVCKEMYRRYQASDISPIEERITRHDITLGLPDWLKKPVDFVFIDPPYWDMKSGDYSSDGNNLANMSLEGFYSAIESIAKSMKTAIRKGGYIAWIISASQKDGKYIDHAIEFFNIFCKYFEPVIRCDVPYTTNIASSATIASAKNAKLILKQTRDLGVFRNGI